MRKSFVALLFVSLSIWTIEQSAADEKNYSAAAFATCSACHLADGAGIPGAFPPLRNRLADIAGLDGGRDYLITAVSFGLMGTIEVGGLEYFGVMAGNSGAMTAEEIAAALNYAVFELADKKTADVPAFTAAEVSSAQSKVTAASPALAGELRMKILEIQGEQWPQ